MLGRRALCSLLRPSVSSVRVGGSGVVAGRLADNTPATATDAAHQDFITTWKKVAPNMEPPKTPLTFMKPRPTVPRSIPTKLTINFVLPYQVELSSKEGSKRSYQGGFMQDMPGEFQHLNKWYSEWIDECERVNNSS